MVRAICSTMRLQVALNSLNEAKKRRIFCKIGRISKNMIIFVVKT